MLNSGEAAKIASARVENGTLRVDLSLTVLCG